MVPTQMTEPNPSSPAQERSLLLAMAAARTAAENRGRDIVVLDMRGHTALFDYFVIATGSSRRQLHAISEEIDHKLEDDLKDKRMGIEGYDESKWIVLDYGSVVMHLFDEETRAFYSLEALWGDAPFVDLSHELRDYEDQIMAARSDLPIPSSNQDDSAFDASGELTPEELEAVNNADDEEHELDGSNEVDGASEDVDVDSDENTGDEFDGDKEQ